MSLQAANELGNDLAAAFYAVGEGKRGDQLDDYLANVGESVRRFHDSIMAASGGATIKKLDDGLEIRMREASPEAAAARQAVERAAHEDLEGRQHFFKKGCRMAYCTQCGSSRDLVVASDDPENVHGFLPCRCGATGQYVVWLTRWELMNLPTILMQLKLDASGFYHCPKCGEPFEHLEDAQLCCDPNDSRPAAYHDMTPKD